MSKIKDTLLIKLNCLYEVFAKYPPTLDWCDYCWSESCRTYLNETPVREISSEFANRLVCESSDHFDSIESYKHYLPRIIEHMTPPNKPSFGPKLGLFNRLNELNYKSWHEDEKNALIDYIDILYQALIKENAQDPDYPKHDEYDLQEWKDGIAYLKGIEELPVYDYEI